MSNILKSLLIGLLLALSFGSAFSTSQAQSGEDFDPSVCIPGPNDAPPLLFGGARPSTLVLNDVDLLSQPPLTPDVQPLLITQLPAGTYLVVLAVDEQTKSYFRVIWPCGEHTFVGWVDASAIRYSTRRANPKPAPPGCARAMLTASLLDDVWISTVSGHIAVVADLYREVGGTPFPRSFYYLTRNGRELRDKERRFETSGPFLINGVVLGADVRNGNAIGFSVITSSDEELHFFGTVYEVPEGCDFGYD